MLTRLVLSLWEALFALWAAQWGGVSSLSRPEPLSYKGLPSMVLS